MRGGGGGGELVLVKLGKGCWGDVGLGEFGGIFLISGEKVGNSG